MVDPLKLGLYVLLLLPGLIFVQIIEYHLLREKKPQFERILDIILWSAIIWVVACASPLWPFCSARNEALHTIENAFKYAEKNDISLSAIEIFNASSVRFFVTVSVLSFFAANVWGIVRRGYLVDRLFRTVTGRDWYSSVAYKFFNENTDKAVVVAVEGNRYMGILDSAPDTKEDRYIILKDVYLLPGPESKLKEIEKLSYVDHLLIKFDDIKEIQALKTENTTRKKGG